MIQGVVPRTKQTQHTNARLSSIELRRIASNSIHSRNHRELVEFLCAIQNSPWFANVGSRHARDFIITRVGTWNAALKHIELLTLLAARKYFWNLVLLKAERMGSPYMPDEILSVSAELSAKGEGLYTTSIRPLNKRVAYGTLFREIGFAAASIWINEPAARNFWTDLIGYYVEGHFPCGWDGKFPHGRLVVF